MFRRISQCTPLHYEPEDSIESYQWFIDGIALSNNQNFEHTYTANGSYSVELMVENNHQCSDTPYRKYNF